MSGITLHGFLHYLPTLLDGISFPSETFSANMFKQNLIRRWGMQCPYIQTPHILKEQIGYWSEEMQSNFAMLYKVFTSDYNPIHNYDWHEDLKETPDITTAHTGDDVTTLSGSDKRQQSGADTYRSNYADKDKHSGSTITAVTGSDRTDYSGANTDTRSERAYNSGDLLQISQDVHSRDSADTVTHGRTDTVTHGEIIDTTGNENHTQSYGKTDTATYGKKDTLTHGLSVHESGTRAHDNHIYGNIGVTTSAQMIESEMLLRRNLNPYDYLTDLFADEFLSKIC